MLIVGDSSCKEAPVFIHPTWLLAIRLELSNVTPDLVILSLFSFSESVSCPHMKPIVRNPERRPLSLMDPRKLSQPFLLSYFAQILPLILYLQTRHPLPFYLYFQYKVRRTAHQ